MGLFSSQLSTTPYNSIKQTFIELLPRVRNQAWRWRAKSSKVSPLKGACDLVEGIKQVQERQEKRNGREKCKEQSASWERMASRKWELPRREGTGLGLQLRAPVTLLGGPQQNGDKGRPCSLPFPPASPHRPPVSPPVSH